jgi:hypothetical protein
LESQKRPRLSMRPRVIASDVGEPRRIAERLRALHNRYFVGRGTELDTFRNALQVDAHDHPVSLLFVHGPGGVGKTVLLRQFGRLAADSGASVIALDGRDLEPSPAGILSALREVAGITDDTPPFQALARRERLVLLIDTYEALTPLDTWMRELFLPQLPEASLVVLAGRQAPAVGWRADPAWSELAEILPLRNLPPGDSRTYLEVRGLPAEQHAAVLEFTHGHPLALSLLTNLLLNGAARTFRPEHAPDIVRALLGRFVDHVPSQSHWQALAACAHARVTTEGLLAEVVAPSEATQLFAWLRDLPFMEQGRQGLYPHDLAREVLEADLRWRDVATYRDLHARMCEALLARLEASRGSEQQSAYFDLLYLVRNSAVARAYYDWTALGRLFAEVALPADHESITALVQRHEGDESARIAEYWLRRQPRSFVVFREASQQIAGFTAALWLEHVTAGDLDADPAVRAAWQFATERSALQPGESIMHQRFFVGRDAHQDTAIHHMVSMVATVRWLTTPGLALSFAAVAQPAHWAPMFESIRFPRTPESDFTVGGRCYATFSHDWRADPVHRWIAFKTELDSGRDDGLLHDTVRSVDVLSRPDFESAVRQAVRDYHRPSLATNPLLRSRFVVGRADGSAGVSALRTLILEAANELHATPKTEKLYRAFAATYLEPARTGELAAELLGLPFNTYRYQLAAAIKYVTDALWQRELQMDSGRNPAGL